MTLFLSGIQKLTRHHVFFLVSLVFSEVRSRKGWYLNISINYGQDAIKVFHGMAHQILNEISLLLFYTDTNSEQFEMVDPKYKVF